MPGNKRMVFPIDLTRQCQRKTHVRHSVLLPWNVEENKTSHIPMAEPKVKAGAGAQVFFLSKMCILPASKVQRTRQVIPIQRTFHPFLFLIPCLSKGKSNLYFVVWATFNLIHFH